MGKAGRTDYVEINLKGGMVLMGKVSVLYIF